MKQGGLTPIMLQNSVRTVALVAVALIALWFTYLAGKQQGQLSRPATEQAGFVLAVGLKFKSTRDRDALLQTWKKLATHTRSKEPGAMSYKWLVADNDPTNVLVYERYSHKQAYTGPHRSSEPFFAFKEAQKLFDIKITGQSYIESEWGFM